jgi:hemerythrin
MGRSAVSPSAGKRQPSAGSRVARQRIDEEHRRLGELLRALDGASDLTQLAPRLAELRALLVGHFASEEGPQGMHDIVAEGAAHRLPNVQRLFEEHAAILVRLDQLSSEAHACFEGPVRRVLAGVAELAATLRRHEAHEEELFSEAFYSDLGGHT